MTNRERPDTTGASSPQNSAAGKPRNASDSGEHGGEEDLRLTAVQVKTLDEAHDALAARLSTIALLTSDPSRQFGGAQASAGDEMAALMRELRVASTTAMEDLRVAVRAMPRERGHVPALAQRWESVPALIQQHQEAGAQIKLSGLSLDSVELSLHAGAAFYALLSTSLDKAASASYASGAQIDVRQKAGMIRIAVAISPAPVGTPEPYLEPLVGLIQRVEYAAGRIVQIVDDHDWKVEVEFHVA